MQIGNLLTVNTYPNSAKSQEEVEELAARQALQQLPQVAKKRQAAKNRAAADYKVSIPRVKQVSKVCVCFLVAD